MKEISLNLARLKKCNYDLFRYARVKPGKKNFAISKKGHVVGPNSRVAVKCCSLGVLYRTCSDDEMGAICLNHVCTWLASLTGWNDDPETTLSDIRREMRIACKKAFGKVIPDECSCDEDE